MQLLVRQCIKLLLANFNSLLIVNIVFDFLNLKESKKMGKSNLISRIHKITESVMYDKRLYKLQLNFESNKTQRIWALHFKQTAENDTVLAFKLVLFIFYATTVSG